MSPLGAAWADWTLDTHRSVVNFISIKNNSVGETNRIRTVEGSIDNDGQVQLILHLTSVETLIDIRNERMRELLFETVQFPVATVTAKIDPLLLAVPNDSLVRQLDVPLTLSMHGREKVLSASVSAVVGDNGDLVVTTTHPLLVNAADFDLEKGIEVLRNIAGLQAISRVVPVTVQLHFVRMN
ncbi:MAG: YceI family protein [Halioglobus sp.]|nr:YceI family protein [Halioglobus sp.]